MARASEALAAIARVGAPFASRGDKSGTHTVELGIWADLKTTPAGAWYRAVGQGMGETLMAASEMGAYTLCDRASWLAASSKVPGLTLFVGGARLADNRDRSLLNYYGVLPINPAKHPGTRTALAELFAAWLVSADTQRAIGAFGASRFGQSLFYPDSDEYKATHQLTVKSGGRAAVLTVGDLRRFPRVALPAHSVIGVKKGVLGPFTWTGASLKDVLLKADPTLSDTRHAGSRIVVRSSDGWAVTIWWDELFGRMPKGFALYNVKGCNECHGPLGEGTAPTGKRPAPALAGIDWPAAGMEEILRAGGDRHAGMLPFTAAQFSQGDIAAMLAWMKQPHQPAIADPYVPPAGRAFSVLAYERDGRPMTGASGLIQLVVGPDEYAGRYSHWVSEIEVVPPVR
jgi:mono/diheme cytochrome c family protein